MSPPLRWFGLGLAAKSTARRSTSASSLAASSARAHARATRSTSRAATLRFSYILSARLRSAACVRAGEGGEGKTGRVREARMGVVRGERRDDVEREWTRTGESSNGAAIAPEGVKLARRARGDERNGFARRAPTRALASRGARGVECDSGNGEAGGDDARASAAADS